MIFIIKPVGLTIQFVFEPVIEELHLLLRVEPVLTILHNGKTRMMCLSKNRNCIDGCQIVCTSVENILRANPLTGADGKMTESRLP